jgi:prevent-host-death family protein
MSVSTLKKPEKNTNWQLQEAKAMFSEVIRKSVKTPQVITVHGKETAVILSFSDYKNLTSPKPSLFDFLQNSPLCNFELELPERRFENMREVSL